MKKLGGIYGIVSLNMFLALSWSMCVCVRSVLSQIILFLGLGSVNYKTGKNWQQSRKGYAKEYVCKQIAVIS